MKQDSNLPSRDVLEALREFDAPLLSNTLDYFDDTPTHELYMSGEIQSVTPSLNPTVGIAVTAQFDTSTPGGGHDMDLHWRQIEEIDAMDLPVVWVVEAVGSRPDHECMLGDGAAKLLYSAGCVGAVTNGRVRDVAGLLTVPFAVYCRGRVAHHCSLRMKAINIPVSVGGITVNPGDVIHACNDGVIKIPTSAIPMLLEKAPLHRAVEHRTHAVWRSTSIPPAEKGRRAKEIYTKDGFARRG